MGNRIIVEIVTQHAEEASFLWILRDGAGSAPHFNLKDLATLDGRVEAHLDGLRIAGDPGWEICQEVLGLMDAGEVFACAVLAFESASDTRMQEVLKKGAAEPMLARGLVSALGWLRYEKAQHHIRSLIATEVAELRRVGIAAAAIHRQDPGSALVSAVSSPDPLLKARALRAVGELGLKSFLPELRKHLQDQDGTCRFSAAWSTALLSADSDALAVLRSVAESSLPAPDPKVTQPYRERALQVAIRRMDPPSANAWQNSLAQGARQVRLAIVVAGAFGDPASIPWLIGHMNAPEVARVAGEAFNMITGVDIANQHLGGKQPEGFEPGPTENPEDENVEMDPDENLPWPDPALIAKWWNAHQGEFQKGTRHLLGKPITRDWLQQVLRIGRQRQRAAAALELAIRQPGQPLFNIAAPGFRQQLQLGLRR
jgi:uncharacterized protein (TIGR02270 family)